MYAGMGEIMGMGYHVDNMQMMQTVKLQLMTPCGSHTKRLHKSITQNKMTLHPRIEMSNDAFGCSRATQVRMEDMRLVNLT